MPSRPPDPFYLNLRRSILVKTPGDLGLGPTASLPHAWGVLFDMALEGDYVSLAAFADGTTSVYTGSSKGIVGLGSRRPVRASAHAWLLIAESLVEIVPADDSIDLPADGTYSVTILTYEGRRRVNAIPSQTMDEALPLASLWMAAWGVHRQLRIAQTAAHGPDWTYLGG